MRTRILDNVTEVYCDTADDWRDFVAANADAIREQHGTIAEGKRLAQYGGMELGGGAAPFCVVTVARNAV